MEKGGVNINYHNITYPDMNNGEGLRVVLWLSGCSHKCKGCQNPQTWYANSGIPFDESAKEELFRELNKDYISGLTLSGGDPLFENNLDDVLNLVTEVNEKYNISQGNEVRFLYPQKTIWLYSGYKFEEVMEYSAPFKNEGILDVDIPDAYRMWIREQIVSKCTVFVDGRYIASQRDITLPYCGSKNQRLIDIQKSLQENKIVLFHV